MSHVSRFEELAHAVDAEFEAVLERNRERMECRPGCSDCCRCRLSVTRVEQAYIRRGLARLPLALRHELKTRATTSSSEMCPALDAGGRCQIYDARPLICRSFGAPLRTRYPVPLIHPSRIDVCDKNFKLVSIDAVPAEDVLDRTSSTEALADIDSRYCAEHGLRGDERVPLAQILAECV